MHPVNKKKRTGEGKTTSSHTQGKTWFTQGIESCWEIPALGAGSLSYWTTREFLETSPLEYD